MPLLLFRIIPSCLSCFVFATSSRCRLSQSSLGEVAQMSGLQNILGKMELTDKYILMQKHVETYALLFLYFPQTWRLLLLNTKPVYKCEGLRHSKTEVKCIFKSFPLTHWSLSDCTLKAPEHLIQFTCI